MRPLVACCCAMLLACSCSTNAPPQPAAGHAGNVSNAGGGVAAGTSPMGGAAPGSMSGNATAGTVATSSSNGGGGASGGGMPISLGGAGAAAGTGGTNAGASGTAGSSGSGGSAGTSAGPALPPKASGVLCVFDYDLTLSTNNCPTSQFDCRTNKCLTYNWYQQCMSSGARHAIQVCVERGAFVGIASHATVDLCWDDKVTPIIAQEQFPALTGAVRYDNAKTDFSYPKLDLRANWNCDTCAYHMNGGFSKPQLISKVMAHYGMDPSNAADRAEVIFWDDLPDNITKTNADMPEVHTVHVHENIDGQPNSGGCGILESDVTAGWAPFPQ
jgi:hypothetical protein